MFSRVAGLAIVWMISATLLAARGQAKAGPLDDVYKALEMRIWPDVRPGDRQNPLAPLVMVTL